MFKNKLLICLLFPLILSAVNFAFTKTNAEDEDILSYQVNPKKQDLQLYWKDEKGQPFQSIQRLKDWLQTKNRKLVFAMNAGMYMTDHSPLGLFIQDGKTIKAINKKSASGNFYLKPNGIFYIDNENNAGICRTEDFSNNSHIKYATQSGPMLLIDGKIHPSFTAGSQNLNIRNGVGILPDHTVLFAMSEKGINFYDFANYFRKRGCKNALYLDGFVCRTYLPEKNWMQLDGDFGVMIGVTAPR